MENQLRIRGARQHNLKNIDLDIPKNKLIVFTGLSGSGKSSLAFDTIYAEGQRRYVESLSSYARQFLGVMDKPDVDAIEGLSPAISIDQKSTSHNPRSTVGTVTEIYDYLRLLFARVGHPHCPNCGREISKQSAEQIVYALMRFATLKLRESGNKHVRFLLLSPIVRDRKGEFSGLFENVRAKGYRDVRVDGHMYSLEEDLVLIKTNKHTIDVVIDRITLDQPTIKMIQTVLDTPPSQQKETNASVIVATLRSRLNEAVEQALSLSDGLLTAALVTDSGFSMPEKPKHMEDHIFSERFSCPVCNISLPEIEPRSFSFNSPHGACPSCTGLGTILTVDESRVISPELSISEGGILPFAKMFFHDTWFSRVVNTVCEHHNIDMRKPLNRMSEKQKSVLLYGTGDHIYRVKGTNKQGRMTEIHETYLGLIPELKRRYHDSDSDFVKTEIEKYMREEICPSCDGKRLKKEALTVTIDKQSIADVTKRSIKDSAAWVDRVLTTDEPLLSPQERTIATPIIKEITARLSFLVRVGLDYLTLGRSATTLAGGEAQRIRLASQIGSGLSGVLYVLDEPSIGLHQRDNRKLVDTLKSLRDLGNTVIVVEHDRDMMDAADVLVDIGPGAGEHGGQVVVSGTPQEVKDHPKSVTAKYLKNHNLIQRIRRDKKFSITSETPTLRLLGAAENNLKKVDLTIPLGKLVCISGVSGSGKSTLIVETLYRAIHNHFNPFSKDRPGVHGEVEGLKLIDKVILIDQSPIGRTPRSNPATYTGLFTLIRDLFAQLPEAKVRGYKPGRFSFNVKGGRCEACEGEGQKKIEMQFLSDIYVSCEVCHGTRYNAETLEVHYHGKNIAQILDMTVGEARNFFANHPQLLPKLETIQDVGLDYVHIGQPAPTLSGGEAQRIKLATELARRSTGQTLYILDEPTTGLHFADLEKLLDVLDRLVALGNTVVVIEHNLDIIKNADWIIDMGPEGGDGGGEILVTGTPEKVANHPSSHTGVFLKELMNHDNRI